MFRTEGLWATRRFSWATATTILILILILTTTAILIFTTILTTTMSTTFQSADSRTIHDFDIDDDEAWERYEENLGVSRPKEVHENEIETNAIQVPLTMDSLAAHNKVHSKKQTYCESEPNFGAPVGPPAPESISVGHLQNILTRVNDQNAKQNEHTLQCRQRARRRERPRWVWG